MKELDKADTQSRSLGGGVGNGNGGGFGGGGGKMIRGGVRTASRRAARDAGGELEWHRTDVLGRIGFKLAQYSMLFLPLHLPSLLIPSTPSTLSPPPRTLLILFS